MAELISRVAGTLVAIVYVLGALVTGGLGAALTVSIYMAIPMGCIWLPDELGSIAFAHGLPLKESPGAIVIVLGWVLLLLPIVWYFIGNTQAAGAV